MYVQKSTVTNIIQFCLLQIFFENFLVGMIFFKVWKFFVAPHLCQDKLGFYREYMDS